MNNLLVLARESETGAARVWKDGKIVGTLLKVIDDGSATEGIVVAAARVLDELAKNSKRVWFLSLLLLLRRKIFGKLNNFKKSCN